MLCGLLRCCGWQEEHALERRSKLLLITRESIEDVLRSCHLELECGRSFEM
jgi:hypothetical protein